MSRREIWEKVKSQKYISYTAAVLLVLLVFGVTAVTFYQGTGFVEGSDNMISYCGEPDFFEDFSDQNGYTPNERCTDVVIDDYRIDTEDSSSYYVNDNLQWGCSASVTVYEIQGSGDLEKITDSGERSPDPDDVEVGPLTVQPLSQSSGLDFTNRCDWIANDYEYDFQGGVNVSASTPDDAYEMDEVPISVDFVNNYDRDVSGTLSAEFCTEGAFGMERCVSRSTNIALSPGESASETFTVPNENLGEVVEASASFDGEISISGWEGVNVDCDQDNKIERIEDCDGFPVTASQDLEDIVLSEPVDTPEISGPETVSPSEEATYSISASSDDSISYTWSNGETGESASYSWNSTGNQTVSVTVDDGLTEETEEMTVKVERTLLGSITGFFDGLWNILFQG